MESDRLADDVGVRMVDFAQALGDAFSAGAGRPTNREQINENAMRSVYLGAETQDAFARAALSSTQAQAAEQRLQAQQNVGASYTKLLISRGMDPEAAAERGQVYATIQLSGGNLEQIEHGITEGHWSDIEADATNPNLRGTDQQQLAQNALKTSGRWKPEDQYQVLPNTGMMVDKFSGSIVPEPMTALATAAAQAGIAAKNAAAQRTGSFSQLQPEQQQKLTQMLSGGYIDPRSMYSFSRNPSMIDAAYGAFQGDPSGIAGLASAKQAMAHNYAAGADHQNIVRIGTAVQHLDALPQVAAALHNGDITALNRIASFFGYQTGNSAPSEALYLANALGKEVNSAYVQGGGGEAERMQTATTFDARSLSPQQILGNAQLATTLLRGRTQELEDTYSGVMGVGPGASQDQARTEFRERYLANPHLRQVLGMTLPQDLYGGPAANTGGSAPVAPTGPGSVPGPAGPPPASTGNPPRLNVSPVAPSSGGGQPQVPPAGAPPPLSEEDYLNQAMAQLHPGFNRAVTPQIAPVNAVVQQ